MSRPETSRGVVSETPERRRLRVLIVEDSEDDAALLLRELRRGGYEPDYLRVDTPEGMEQALADGEPWELIISDYFMPRFRAPEALALLRRLGHDTPFIIVSGKVGEELAVEAMRAGAQDYITKENMVRLNAAIERELKESGERRERRRAEEALSYSENRFQRLVEQAADAIFVYRPDGQLLDVNRQACESLGYTREELLEMSLLDIEVGHKAEELVDVRGSLVPGTQRTVEGTHRRKDGTTFPVEVRVGVLASEGEQLKLALARDITERREAERRISETETLYKALVEQIPAVTYIQDPETKRVRYISPQIEDVLGYPPDRDILDEDHWIKIMHPDDRERVIAEDERTDASGEPFRIEYRQFARDGRMAWIRDEAVLVRDERGQPLYWQGVQYDITDQKRVEEELRESEERYRATFDQAAVGFLQVGLEGEWLQFNDKLCDILGYSREELSQISVFDLISMQDFEKDFERGVKMLAGEIRDYTEEKAIIGKDEREIWINLTVSLIYDDTDAPRYFSAVVEDISQRKLAESGMALRDRAISSSSNGIVMSDPNLPDNPIVYTNPAFERITGYTSEEVLGRNCRFLQGGDRDQAALEELREAVRERRECQVVLRNYRKDGTPFWNELSVSPVWDEGGHLISFIGVQDDITERIRAEEALQVSESRFRTMIEQSPLSIQILSPYGRTLQVNRAWERLFETDLESLGDYNVLEDRQLVEQGIMPQLLKAFAGEPARIPPIAYDRYRSIPELAHPEQPELWVQTYVYPVKDEAGKVREVVLMHEDVTERKRAEEELIWLASFPMLNPNPIVETTLSGELTYLNPAAEAHFPKVRSLGTDHPALADLAEMREMIWSSGGRPVTREVRIGERFYQQTISRVPEGDLLRIYAAETTERRRAEEAVRESEQRFRSLVQNASDIIVVLDAEGTITYESPSIQSILGYTPEERIGTRAFDYIHPDDRERTKASFANYVKGDAPRSAVEYRARAKDGAWHYFEAIGTNLLENPAVEGIVVNSRDVTERKRAEDALLQSEQLYRTVVEQAAENIFIVDAETKEILEANAAFVLSLGYTEEEIRSLTIYDIVGHEPESVDANIERILASGRHFLGERVYRRKDGTSVDMEVSASAISYQGESAMCVVAHDLTDRKRTEEAMREVREAERSRIARDLHDDILQNLVYALQEIQILQVTSEDGGDTVLEDTADALRRSVEGLRVAIFELRLSESLERSFASSMRALLEVNRRMSRRRFTIEMSVADEFPQEIPEPRGRELLRIVQEALTNARRHASPSHVRIELGIDGETAWAEVTDDGAGFLVDESDGGVGMSSMRQRALGLGGEIKIQSAPGRGTRMRFEILLERLVSE